jgi:protein-L-isoaspartate(D-aspartate) O-methyltransferase
MQQQRALLVETLRYQGISDQRVLEAIGRVPRHQFVDEALIQHAYANTALPIGAQQTISQPYIVARMTELLQLTPHAKVLEIGTGSGYQTAVLSLLAAQIYTIERIQSLYWQAKRRFKQLALHAITTRHGDGSQGWPSQAPFNAIIVTAAPPSLPELLTNQLTANGRLVVPVGQQQQTLLCLKRQGNECQIEAVEPVRFVPLIPGELA